MSEELKRMRQRHGTYTEMTSQESLPNEFLIVDSGDEATQDGEALYYVTSNNERKRLVTADEGIPADSVDTNQIVDGAVTADKIGTGEIKESHIATGAVTGAKIAGGAVTSAKIGNGEVKTVNLADEAVTKEKLSLTLQSFVDNGYVQKIATVSTLSELESKLYHINPCIYFLTLTGACATAFNVQSGAKARLIMFGDWNSSITRWLKIIDNGAEWTQALTISNGSYTFGTWTRLSKELLYGELPSELVDEINTKIAYDSAVITNGSQLNTANYAVPEIEIGVKLTSQAAAGFQVESGTIGLLKTVEADGVIKRYMTFPEIEGVKWVQTVNSIAPSWSAGIWTKVDFSVEADTKIDKPTKCIYFDEDDCVYTLTSGIHIGGARVGITSVYAPSSVTEIPDRALVSTPDLTTIYIDNASSAVTLGTDIQAAVNNNELTIYYKGQFNLANILATSQKKLNLRLISLEATVGTVNTILENAINGVS